MDPSYFNWGRYAEKFVEACMKTSPAQSGLRAIYLQPEDQHSAVTMTEKTSQGQIQSSAGSILSICANLRRLGATSGIGALDGLRAISILWVIAYHTSFYYINPYRSKPFSLQRLAMAGDLGVDIFFVLSGYLICSILLSELKKTGTIVLRRFYLHRILRIIPAYYVVLFIYATIGLPAMFYPKIPKIYILANIFFVNNYLPIDHQFMNLAWSLAIEEHFYLLFPGLLLLLSWRRALSSASISLLLLGSIVIAVADAVLRGYTLPIGSEGVISFDGLIKYFEFSWRTHIRFGSLVWGILLAFLRSEYPSVSTPSQTMRRLTLLLGMAFMTFSIIFHPTNPSIKLWPNVMRYIYTATHRDVFACGVFFMMNFMLSPGPDSRPSFIVKVLAYPFWRPIAHLSYGAYLLNEIVMAWFFVKTNLYQIFSDTWFWAISSFLIATALTLAAAMILYLMVERPLMNVRSVIDRKYFKNRQMH